MRRVVVKLSLLFSIFFLFSSHAVAADSYFGNSSEKFVSGIANAVTGWVELPKNVILTSQKEGPVYGATIGVAMGVMHTVGRSLVGVLDAATFFIPTKPSVNPPFIWQDFSRETSY
ncbi:MAG: exosortase system-associated protein, TIGR04073 family [Nitrosomonas sp.]|nr:exosortase system-associated protein, TIGR04073 family [Nitrosomonas sp.]